MHKLVYFFFIITYLFANSFDNWVDKNINVLEEKVKSISFQIKLEPNNPESQKLNGTGKMYMTTYRIILVSNKRN